MTTVTLKIKQEDGSVKPYQHEIEEINLDQFQKAMVTLKSVMATLSENPALVEIFAEALQDDGEEDEKMDKKFLTMATSAFEVLFVELPEHAYDLIATMADIEPEVLKKQKMMAIPDIFDAILEENDLEKLYKRTKKSFAVTKAKLGWIKLTRQATTPVQH